MLGGSAAVAAPAMEQHSPYGFRARPLDPDADGKGAQALFAFEGSRGHAIALEDPRVTPLLPEDKKGGSCHYCGHGGFANFDGDDATWTLYVPAARDSAGKVTKAHTVTVGLDGNKKRVINVLHADGMRITMLAEGKNAVVIANRANNVWLSVNDDGVEINGNLKVKGNIGAGPLMTAWQAAVTAALTGLGASPGPPPISLTS